MLIKLTAEDLKASSLGFAIWWKVNKNKYMNGTLKSSEVHPSLQVAYSRKHHQLLEK